MKYLTFTIWEVEKAIAKILPDRFASLLDGWTRFSTHYLAAFTSFIKLTLTEIAQCKRLKNVEGDHRDQVLGVSSEFRRYNSRKRTGKGSQSNYLDCIFCFLRCLSWNIFAVQLDTTLID